MIRPKSAFPVLLTTLVLACTRPSLLMRPQTSEDVVGSDVMARVTVIAPRALRDIVTIVDEMGRYRGQIGAQTRTSFELEPGSHRIYAFLNATEHVVVGELEAGKQYYVRAERPVGARFIWLPWTPGCDAASESELRSTQPLVVDPNADRVLLLQELGDVPRRVREADARFDHLEPDERQRRVMQPRDC